MVQRNGALEPGWEAIIRGPQPSLCPLSLVCAYVSLTSAHCPEGSPLLRSLRPPYPPPLKANTIGSITKKLLSDLGVPMGIFGAHSTRGAGVQFYKQLGLSSEEVCELGKWKNTSAFTSHYLRIGAASAASQKLRGLVHNVSPMGSAEPDQSRTPGSASNPGGRDWEGEAQSIGDPPSPPIEGTGLPSKRPPSPGGLSSEPPVKFQFAKPKPPPTASKKR